MKYVVIYEGSPDMDMDRIRQAFPAHRATWEPIRQRGDLLLIGPFSDPKLGSLAVFRTRAAAEEFVRNDPFVLQKLVSKWEIREWREAIMPEP